jgi:hypothetical protein
MRTFMLQYPWKNGPTHEKRMAAWATELDAAGYCSDSPTNSITPISSLQHTSASRKHHKVLPDSAATAPKTA